MAKSTKSSTSGKKRKKVPNQPNLVDFLSKHKKETEDGQNGGRSDEEAESPDEVDLVSTEEAEEVDGDDAQSSPITGNEPRGPPIIMKNPLFNKTKSAEKPHSDVRDINQNVVSSDLSPASNTLESHDDDLQSSNSNDPHSSKSVPNSTKRSSSRNGSPQSHQESTHKPKRSDSTGSRSSTKGNGDRDRNSRDLSRFDKRNYGGKPKKGWMCYVCDKVYANENIVRAHLIKVHKINEEELSPKKNHANARTTSENDVAQSSSSLGTPDLEGRGSSSRPDRTKPHTAANTGGHQSSVKPGTASEDGGFGTASSDNPNSGTSRRSTRTKATVIRKESESDHNSSFDISFDDDVIDTTFKPCDKESSTDEDLDDVTSEEDLHGLKPTKSFARTQPSSNPKTKVSGSSMGNDGYLSGK